MHLMPRPLALVVVAVHAGAVVGFTALHSYLASLTGPEDGTNIGAGMALIPLMLLGIPWSAPMLLLIFTPWIDALPEPLFSVFLYTFTVGAAAINVVLYARRLLHRSTVAPPPRSRQASHR